MNVEQRVRKFIVENFYVTDPSSIDDDTLLVTNGIVDSTGMLEVIAFLEEQFGVRVGDQEMTPENLESVSRIARFIAAKQASTVA